MNAFRNLGVAAMLLWLWFPQAGVARTPGERQPAQIYHDFCSVCHGDQGNGQSRAQGSMRPPPRDFTTPQAARELGRERMLHAVREGRPGTAMVAWKAEISESEIAALVDYIRERFMLSGKEAQAGAGQRLYARTCAVCHGDDGRGAKWATSNLFPPPRNFTSARATRELTRKRMLYSATYGRPDTAMPGFGTQLEAAQIEAVVDYIRGAIMAPDAGQAAVGAGAHGGAHGSGDSHGAHVQVLLGEDKDAAKAPALGADPALPFPRALIGRLIRGGPLYRENCVPCHGTTGNGRGPRAYFILPKPRNFSHLAARRALNRPHLFKAIAKGTRGTEMPAWENVLDEQAIADVAEYVFQQFILEKRRPAGAAPR